MRLAFFEAMNSLKIKFSAMVHVFKSDTPVSSIETPTL